MGYARRRTAPRTGTSCCGRAAAHGTLRPRAEGALPLARRLVVHARLVRQQGLRARRPGAGDRRPRPARSASTRRSSVTHWRAAASLAARVVGQGQPDHLHKAQPEGSGTLPAGNRTFLVPQLRGDRRRQRRTHARRTNAGTRRWLAVRPAGSLVGQAVQLLGGEQPRRAGTRPATCCSSSTTTLKPSPRSGSRRCSAGSTSRASGSSARSCTGGTAASSTAATSWA